MKKSPFIQHGWLVLLILFLPLFVLAQPGRGPRPGPPRELPAELNLSEEQQAQIAAIQEKYRGQIQELRQQAEADPGATRDKMRALMDAQREEINAVLTAEQQARLQSLRDARREEMRDRRPEIDRKALHEELRAYRDENVRPVLQGQRAKLEAKISAEDKTAIAQLRAQLAELRGKGRALADSPDKSKEQRDALREEHRAIFKQARGLADKYDTDIEALLAEIVGQQEQWKKDEKAILDKYRPEKPEERPAPPDRQRLDRPDRPQKPRSPEAREAIGKVEFLLIDPAAPTAPVTRRAGRRVDAQVFPNPAATQATVNYSVKQAGEVRIELRDKEGRLVRVLLDEYRQAGDYNLEIDLGPLNNGVYYYTVIDEAGQTTRQLVVAKE